MRAYTNGGSQDSTLYGKSKLFPKMDEPVWYNPDSLANIYSLAKVTKYYRVTMDSEVENALLVHMGDRVLKFSCAAPGLYKLDNADINVSNNPINNYVFFHNAGTVRDNEARYSTLLEMFKMHKKQLTS